jgi:hypothetical protein
VSDSEIHFPKRNVRSNVTVDKYKKQVQWIQNKVQELLTKGYSQRFPLLYKFDSRQYQKIFLLLKIILIENLT